MSLQTEFSNRYLNGIDVTDKLPEGAKKALGMRKGIEIILNNSKTKREI